MGTKFYLVTGLLLIIICASVAQQSDCLELKTQQKISSLEGGMGTLLNDSDYFSQDIAGIGDFDGDGNNDIAVNAPYDDDAGIDMGAVYLLYLTDSGTVKNYSKIYKGVSGFNGNIGAGDRIGSCITAIGDLDKDNVIDLAVGERSDGSQDEGAIWIWFMNANGTVKSYQKINDIEGGLADNFAAFAGFGTHIEPIGDLNKDGVPDLVVSGTRDTDGGSRRGGLWVLFMNTNGTVKSHQKISDTQGNFTGILDFEDNFGSGIANLGDIDGDGVVDIAVGAEHDDDGGNSRGAIWILFLNTDGTVKSHQKISSTAGNIPFVLNDEATFGHDLSEIGDVDGNGVTDLLVGGAYSNTGGPGRGEGWLVYLNTDGTAKGGVNIDSSGIGFNGTLNDGDAFGWSVEAIGDVSQEGILQVAISARQDDDGGTDRGAVWILNLKVDHTFFTKITSGSIVSDLGISSGASFGDYDNDGDEDLYVSNRNAGFLYKNNGDGTFTRVNSGALVTDDNWTRSTNWIDYDNDGDLDIHLGNSLEPNYLYQNNGNGTFTKITSGSIVTDSDDTHGNSWADYDKDGYLDCFVANSSSQKNGLYHNNGDGTFTKITTGSIATDVYSSITGSWADYDNDEHLDLFVTNDNTNNHLFHNNGDGTFTKVVGSPVVSEGGSTGSSWGDYNNDGFLDLFVTNNNSANFFYENNGDGTFSKITSGSIVTDNSTSVGSAWGDFDNDGHLDLLVTNKNSENNHLYWNNGDGSFTQQKTGTIVNDGGFSLGTALSDIDKDGDLDIFVANYNGENNFLYKNEGLKGNWLMLDIAGESGSMNVVGTRIRIKTSSGWQIREVSSQTGRGGQNGYHVHFGVGCSVSIVDSVIVDWPSGISWDSVNVDVNQYLKVEPRVICQSECVWPGDADNNGTADAWDILPIGLTYGSTGSVRQNATTNWIGQTAQSWGGVKVFGNDVKYIDCDGNGRVDELDVLPIASNYGLTHNKNEGTKGTDADPPLFFQFPQTDSIFAGDTVKVQIHFGNAAIPATKVYGLAFSVNYDAGLLDSGSVQVNFQKSWIGSEGVNMITVSKDLYDNAQVDIGISRTDFKEASNFGEIAELSFVMQDDLAGKDLDSAVMQLSFSNVLVIDTNESSVPVFKEAASFTAYQTETGIKKENISNAVSIYPNPANGVVNIKLRSGTTDHVIIDLMDIRGRILKTSFLSNLNNGRLDLTDVKNGIYLVRVSGSFGITTRKIIIN